MDYGSDSISRFSGVEKCSRRWGVLFIRSGLVLLFILTMFTQPALSQSQDPNAPSAPLPAWTIHDVDSPAIFTNMTDRALAFKPDGTPCAAYGGDGLYYACYNKSTGFWDRIEIDASVGVGQYASLAFYTDAVTNATEAFVAYYDATNGALKFAYTQSGFWHYDTVPTPPAEFGTPDAAAATEEPAPVGDIDFMAELQQIQAPWMSILEQNDPNIVFESNGVGKYTSINADSWGIYISYYDDRVGPSGENSRNLNFAYWNGVSWYFKLVDYYRDHKAVGLWSSLKVDYNHNAHIAYMSEKYDDLKYAFWNHNKDEWTIVTVDGDDPIRNTGSMTSLALWDPKTPGIVGVPYISYLDFSPNPDNGNPKGILRLARLENLKANLWTKSTVDDVGITGWWSSIAVNYDKKVFISYYLAYSNNRQGDLKYATGKVGGSWSLTTLRSGDAIEGQFTSIAVSPTTGWPAVLNYNASAGWLQYTYFYSANRWTTILVDTYGHDVGYGTSLALTSSGVPHISYLDSTLGTQKYARSYGTTFAKSYPLTSIHSGLYSSIDTYGDAVGIAAYDTDHGDLLYGSLTPGGWWYYRIVDESYDVGQFVSMKLGSNGAPQMSYYDATNKNLIYAAWNVGGSYWVTQTVDDTGDVGMYSNLALSSDGRPYISYFDEDHDSLKMAYKGPFPGVWIKETVAVCNMGNSTDTQIPCYTAIDLDSSNNPSISYYDGTQGDLKFASWNGSAWNIETLDPLSATEDLGLFNSLKINRTDNTRHLCYYNKTESALMYARYSGTWEYQTVDSSGDVGYSCSIDLNGAGEPAISYYDNSRADLKLAISFTLPPAKTYLPVILKP